MVLLWLAPCLSHAQGTSTLEWSDSTGRCPAPAEPEREIARLLGDNAPTQAASFRAEVSEHAAGFNLALGERDGARSGTRNVQLATCQEVQEAAILLVAMALQGDAALLESAPPAEEPAEPEAKEEPSATEVGSSDPSARGARWATLRDSLRLEAGAVLAAKALPHVSGGPAFGVSVRALEVLRLGLSMRYLAKASVAKSELLPGAEASAALWTSVFEAQLTFAQGALTWGPAAELELGALRAHAKGTTESRGKAAWASLGAGMAAAVAVHRRVEITSRALLSLPFTRPQLALDASAPFYTTPPVGFRLLIGVRCTFGPTE